MTHALIDQGAQAGGIGPRGDEGALQGHQGVIGGLSRGEVGRDLWVVSAEIKVVQTPARKGVGVKGRGGGVHGPHLGGLFAKGISALEYRFEERRR